MKIRELELDQKIEINGHQYKYKGLNFIRRKGFGKVEYVVFEGLSKGSEEQKLCDKKFMNKDLKIHSNGLIELK